MDVFNGYSLIQIDKETNTLFSKVMSNIYLKVSTKKN